MKENKQIYFLIAIAAVVGLAAGLIGGNIGGLTGNAINTPTDNPDSTFLLRPVNTLADTWIPYTDGGIYLTTDGTKGGGFVFRVWNIGTTTGSVDYTTLMTMPKDGTLWIKSLAKSNDGNAYVCVNSDGGLIRSKTPCSSSQPATGGIAGTTSASLCGNNKLDSGELCDGIKFGGKTCINYNSAAGQKYNSGTLKCNADCTIDTSSCNFCEGKRGEFRIESTDPDFTKTETLGGDTSYKVVLIDATFDRYGKKTTLSVNGGAEKTLGINERATLSDGAVLIVNRIDITITGSEQKWAVVYTISKNKVCSK